jgi:hypothetical protein
MILHYKKKIEKKIDCQSPKIQTYKDKIWKKIN